MFYVQLIFEIKIIYHRFADSYEYFMQTLQEIHLLEKYAFELSMDGSLGKIHVANNIFNHSKILLKKILKNKLLLNA